jgi:hypothetical protein
MPKYVLEGGVDFFSELYNTLDIHNINTDLIENLNSDTSNNNLCLISHQPLIDKFVELECGHKFNYLPLYLDIKNHKYKFNSMEGKHTHLKMNEIRCPYCRGKNKRLLPYYEELGLPKIHGVNCEISNSLSIHQKCSYLTLNLNYDPTNPTDEFNPEFIKCNYNSSHLNCGDNKYYCWNHSKKMIKKYNKEIANKMKEDIKNTKLLIKEKTKQQKINDKINAKLNAKNAKLETNKPIFENKNIVISSDISNNDYKYCVEILKFGSKKGNMCNCIIFAENKCKRHYNLENKKSNIV